jgi:formate-dependent nitrite reductase membrane component NrfD
MTEIAITTGKHAHEAGASIGIWGWEIPVYLFLGGVTAGIMVVAAIAILQGRDKKWPAAANKLILWAPVLISAGMAALFLDLSHKLYVWNFYLTFQITSPMSWGAWILVLVYPLTFLLILATFKKGYPDWYAKGESWIKASPLGPYIKWLYKAIQFAEKYKKIIAGATLSVGVLLGIYTGILLSSFGARPFWNSAILGPLFLISGASTGTALVVLMASDHGERSFFTRADLGLIATELFILALFLIGLASSSQQHIEAAKLVLGGTLTPAFWIAIVFIGLMLPAFFEILELKGREIPKYVPPVLVLTGGLFLRIVFVYAGQVSAWAAY